MQQNMICNDDLRITFQIENLGCYNDLHDRALAVANVFETNNAKLEVAHARLLEDFAHLKNGSRVIKGELIKLTGLMLNLKLLI